MCINVDITVKVLCSACGNPLSITTRDPPNENDMIYVFVKPCEHCMLAAKLGKIIELLSE
jgi:hypothetical protein